MIFIVVVVICCVIVMADIVVVVGVVILFIILVAIKYEFFGIFLRFFFVKKALIYLKQFQI